jgi:hypothetical protein
MIIRVTRKTSLMDSIHSTMGCMVGGLSLKSIKRQTISVDNIIDSWIHSESVNVNKITRIT